MVIWVIKIFFCIVFLSIFPPLLIILGLCLVTQLCLTLCNTVDLYPTRLLCPWDSLGKNTGVGCHALLQRIFLTQELNLCLSYLLHWQVDFSTTNPLGKPSSLYPTSNFSSSAGPTPLRSLSQWHTSIPQQNPLSTMLLLLNSSHSVIKYGHRELYFFLTSQHQSQCQLRRSY